jgi:hypothetical protein
MWSTALSRRADSFSCRRWDDLATKPLGENFTNEPFHFGSFQTPRLLCNHQRIPAKI